LRARSAGASSGQSGWYSQISDGPYVSVSPYRCVTSIPIACTAAIVSAVGGAPPTAARIVRSAVKPVRLPARASSASTTGAPHRCVTGCRAIRSSAPAASKDDWQTWLAPTAVTPQVSDHPLQWNIGSVHRYALSAASPNSSAMLVALRYAPRCVYITPFGRPVVPDV
jgi:hypothetical protein